MTTQNCSQIWYDGVQKIVQSLLWRLRWCQHKGRQEEQEEELKKCSGAEEMEIQQLNTVGGPGLQSGFEKIKKLPNNWVNLNMSYILY